MSHGLKLLVQNLNQHFTHDEEEDITVEKELYRIMKGIAKLYWGRNLVKIQSFIILVRNLTKADKRNCVFMHYLLV